MTRVADEYRMARLVVRPWPGVGAGPEGYDPRSDYVEHFWLAVLGPSTVLFLRRLAMGLDRWPDGFECSTRELSWSLGLGRLGNGASLGRIIRRSGEFGMTSLEPGGQLLVRRLMPPLPPHMLRRLPVWLQEDQRRYRRQAMAATPA